MSIKPDIQLLNLSYNSLTILLSNVESVLCYNYEFSLDGIKWRKYTNETSSKKTFENLISGKQYYIRAKAILSDGSESDYSDTLILSTPPNILPNLKILKITNKDVLIGWDFVDYNVKYIFEGVEKNMPKNENMLYLDNLESGKEFSIDFCVFNMFGSSEKINLKFKTNIQSELKDIEHFVEFNPDVSEVYLSDMDTNVKIVRPKESYVLSFGENLKIQLNPENFITICGENTENNTAEIPTLTRFLLYNLNFTHKISNMKSKIILEKKLEKNKVIKVFQIINNRPEFCCTMKKVNNDLLECELENSGEFLLGVYDTASLLGNLFVTTINNKSYNVIPNDYCLKLVENHEIKVVAKTWILPLDQSAKVNHNIKKLTREAFMKYIRFSIGEHEIIIDVDTLQSVKINPFLQSDKDTQVGKQYLVPSTKSSDKIILGPIVDKKYHFKKFYDVNPIKRILVNPKYNGKFRDITIKGENCDYHFRLYNDDTCVDIRHQLVYSGNLYDNLEGAFVNEDNEHRLFSIF